MSNNQTPNPDFPVITAHGGTAENVVPVSHIQIPDMWHAYASLSNLAKRIRELEALDIQGNDEAGDKLARLKDALADIDPDYLSLAYPGYLESLSENILRAWHLAHDLKRNLSGEVRSTA